MFRHLSAILKEIIQLKKKTAAHIRHLDIFCLWFRASLIYINTWSTRCNTKQSIYYSASSLYMFRMSTTPIIRSTQNCNYSLRYWSYFLCSNLPSTCPSLATLEGGCCTVQEAVVTVLCTHDGCGWHPKHVEWTCRIINRLLCVASRWTIINTNSHYCAFLCWILPWGWPKKGRNM